jgi:hypothetical protein
MPEPKNICHIPVRKLFYDSKGPGEKTSFMLSCFQTDNIQRFKDVEIGSY